MRPHTSNDGVTITPEAVALRMDVAGLGSRMIALILDSLIQGAVLLVLFLGFGPGFSALGASEDIGGILFVSTTLLVIVGYFPVLEAVMHGRTPGKRAQRIRVVQSDGQPVRLRATLVRNLLRIVDFLPTSYAAGVIVILATKKSQRIGDLAAGTVVVRERPPVVPTATPIEEWSRPAAIDASWMTEAEYAAVRAFLQRRNDLDPGARAHLAEKIAAAVRARAGNPPVARPEELLEMLARAYRERFSAPEV